MSNEAYFAPLTVPVLAETDHERAVGAAARSRGYAAGYADGRRSAALEQERWLAAAQKAQTEEAAERAAQLAAAVSTLHAAARGLRDATLPVQADVEASLVAAAFDLAEAVVGAALVDELAAARAAVARVIEADAEGAVAAIRLHPADADLLDDVLEGVHASRGMLVVRDPSISRGDAIGELPGGWLDARIGAALERSKAVLS
ncbi:FliH/SctL family protein [Leifsonia sp. AG29]|uniref:FliH/SctL family protein n=1 Tax=Leifsonia sp. AG29 TaxID=2598860 RepID=UPI00131C9D7C|nr:FliH/SctL family protein [Leifsonia sp. AG29]